MTEERERDKQGKSEVRLVTRLQAETNSAAEGLHVTLGQSACFYATAAAACLNRLGQGGGARRLAARPLWWRKGP